MSVLSLLRSPAAPVALDRMRAISAFSFDEFAIVPASGSQRECSHCSPIILEAEHAISIVKDNQAKQATIRRRPSRVLAGPKRSFVQPPGASTLAPPVAAQGQPVPIPGSLGAPPGAAGGSFRPATMGVSSALAIPVLLRVRLPPAPSVDEINTTVSVPNDMYMSDVLGKWPFYRGCDSL